MDEIKPGSADQYINNLENASEDMRALHSVLQELIGLHRQLLDVVRQENEALVQADTKATFEAVATKEALLHWIQQAERNRQSAVYRLAQNQGKINVQSSLREIINSYQKDHAEFARALESDLSALVVLVDRVQKQNRTNASLVEQSIKHVTQMRNNILKETPEQGKTYTAQGQASVAGAGHSKLVSREA